MIPFKLKIKFGLYGIYGPKVWKKTGFGVLSSEVSPTWVLGKLVAGLRVGIWL